MERATLLPAASSRYLMSAALAIVFICVIRLTRWGFWTKTLAHFLYGPAIRALGDRVEGGEVAVRVGILVLQLICELW